VNLPWAYHSHHLHLGKVGFGFPRKQLVFQMMLCAFDNDESIPVDESTQEMTDGMLNTGMMVLVEKFSSPMIVREQFLLSLMQNEDCYTCICDLGECKLHFALPNLEED
jgi:hypothetical protein